jgi:hypothetical protein
MTGITPTASAGDRWRLVPILGWIRSYDRGWLRGDLVAGVAVAALIVPKNLGYAGIAGIPLQNGLYAAAAGAILYAVFVTIAAAEEGIGQVEPLKVIAEELGYGAVAGVVAGALGAWVLRRFGGRGWMEGTWRQITAVATALLAYTGAAALGGSGFIAAFIAGSCSGSSPPTTPRRPRSWPSSPASCSTPSPSCCSGRCCWARCWASWTGRSPPTRWRA